MDDPGRQRAPWGSSWPAHPQTQGKLERFHRPVAADVFAGRTFADLAAAQQAFDVFRPISNHDRPHEAVGHRPPDTRYARSPRAFPETLPDILDADDATPRIVTTKGIIQFQGYRVYVGEAFAALPVGIVRVQFCRHHLRTIDLRDLAKG